MCILFAFDDEKNIVNCIYGEGKCLRKMDFGPSFGIHLLFVVCFDSIWLTLNFKYFSPGFIYPENAKSKLPFSLTIVYCFLCWIVSALYLAGHQQDTEVKALVEGAWVGSLVYAVFNLTTLVMNEDWKVWRAAIVDTLWGTVLFSMSALLSTAIANTYF